MCNSVYASKFVSHHCIYIIFINVPFLIPNVLLNNVTFTTANVLFNNIHNYVISLLEDEGFIIDKQFKTKSNNNQSKSNLISQPYHYYHNTLSYMLLITIMI